MLGPTYGDAFPITPSDSGNLAAGWHGHLCRRHRQCHRRNPARPVGDVRRRARRDDSQHPGAQGEGDRDDRNVPRRVGGLTVVARGTPAQPLLRYEFVRNQALRRTLLLQGRLMRGRATLDELAREFCVFTRTVRRDLEVMSEVGIDPLSVYVKARS